MSRKLYEFKSAISHSTAEPFEFIELASELVSGRQVLADEAGIAISFNGLNHAVMMATPQDLDDFVAGFCLSNGLIESPEDILDIEMLAETSNVRIDVTLTNRAFSMVKQLRRNLAGATGCGLCGVEALEQVFSGLSERQNAGLPLRDHLHGLRERFQREQTLVRESGAMHAAIYVDSSGSTQFCREDIGRHNALDKLLGACIRQRLPVSEGFVAVTSRCSLELVHKAIRAGIGTLVSLSAPTGLSVRCARSYGLNLLHQPACSNARCYSPGALR